MGWESGKDYVIMEGKENLICSCIHEAIFKYKSRFFSILRRLCKKNHTENWAANIEEEESKLIKIYAEVE